MQLLRYLLTGLPSKIVIIQKSSFVFLVIRKGGTVSEEQKNELYKRLQEYRKKINNGQKAVIVKCS